MAAVRFEGDQASKVNKDDDDDMGDDEDEVGEEAEEEEENDEAYAEAQAGPPSPLIVAPVSTSRCTIVASGTLPK